MLRDPRKELARLAWRKRVWDLERRAHKLDMRHLRAMQAGDRRTAREAEAALIAVSRRLLVEMRN